jgi:hypothetical protein
VPVKFSFGARRDGREPARWISIRLLPVFALPDRSRRGGGAEAHLVPSSPNHKANTLAKYLENEMVGALTLVPPDALRMT